MQTTLSHLGFMRRTVVLAAFLGAGATLMSAQTSERTAPAGAPSTPTVSSLSLVTPSVQTSAEPVFSSSNDANGTEVASNTHFDFLGAMNAMQYGGRRSGRPRYRGGNSNPDGSNRWEFFGGAGFTLPVGDLHTYNSPSWGVQVGGGRNFNKNFGVNLEFNWDNFGLQGNNLTNQQNLYNTLIGLYDTGLSPNDPNYVSQISGLGGYSHVWSFSLQPVYNIAVNEGLGAYVTGGVGFYHKITTFTVPGTGTYCDYYGFCYQYAANQPIDSYTSNAPGVNGGLGVTWKFSRFTNERFYAEARYVYMLNSQRSGVTLNTLTAANINASNLYPANSHRTSYIPVKFGIRF